MPRRDRPTTIPLGNHFDIILDGVAVRGVKDDTLVFRGYIAAGRDDDAAIHPSLQATAVAEGGNTGDYIAAILGENITTHLENLVGEKVWVVGESVPPGAYRDAYPVTVVPDQGG